MAFLVQSYLFERVQCVNLFGAYTKIFWRQIFRENDARSFSFWMNRDGTPTLAHPHCHAPIATPPILNEVQKACQNCFQRRRHLDLAVHKDQVVLSPTKKTLKLCLSLEQSSFLVRNQISTFLSLSLLNMVLELE